MVVCSAGGIIDLAPACRGCGRRRACARFADTYRAGALAGSFSRLDRNIAWVFHSGAFAVDMVIGTSRCTVDVCAGRTYAGGAGFLSGLFRCFYRSGLGVLHTGAGGVGMVIRTSGGEEDLGAALCGDPYTGGAGCLSAGLSCGFCDLLGILHARAGLIGMIEFAVGRSIVSRCRVGAYACGAWRLACCHRDRKGDLCRVFHTGAVLIGMIVLAACGMVIQSGIGCIPKADRACGLAAVLAGCQGVETGIFHTGAVFVNMVVFAARRGIITYAGGAWDLACLFRGSL